MTQELNGASQGISQPPLVSSGSKDFAPTKERVSLHGLGFIQVALPANKRLHVWHPDLPRRSCFEHSAIHNHRFSFKSTVMIGKQFNQRYECILRSDGRYDRISHDGPRSDKGGRMSFINGRADLMKSSPCEIYEPGESYLMPMLQYHDTPNSGIVVTLMEKMEEGTTHAHSIITHGHVFDQSFDRFQLSQYRLMEFVAYALSKGSGE